MLGHRLDDADRREDAHGPLHVCGGSRCAAAQTRSAEPDDIPYYPIRRVAEKAQLLEYVGLAREVRNVTFVGRLGTYRYLDMDVTIKEALDAAAVIRDGLASGERIAAFSVDPLA
jgi:UDP-galactopyranose mutase